MPFTPPENATKEQKSGFQCCGSIAFEAWRARTGRSFDDVLRLLGGGSKATLSKWRNSAGVPSAPTAAQLEEISEGAVSRDSWAWWEPLGDHEEQPVTPVSEKRPVANLPELTGTPAERLRTLETWLESHARGEGLTTDRHRAVTTLQCSLQAQVRAKPIPDLHEHPDFEAFFDIVLGALAKHPGAAKAVIGALKARLSTEAEAA